MTCKNCTASLFAENSFCAACGAKIIKNRITVKSLISDVFLNAFGWDNKYFKTIKALILQPGQLFREYIGGTRKKYMNPLSFLGIGVTLALFIFNIFSGQFVKITSQSNTQTNQIMVDFMEKKFGDKLDTDKMQADMEVKQREFSLVYLKYFNVVIVLLMPLYALISFLVYRKPYNYGEHFIVNCYILGLSFLATSLFFLINLFTAPSIYYLTMVLLIIYYTYAYGKLYQLSIQKALLKLLKFVGVLLLIIPILSIFVFIIMVIFIAPSAIIERII